MKKRVTGIIAALLSVAAIWLLLWKPARPTEPVYQGKTTRHWLQQLKGDDASLIAGLKAFNAIGVRGIPFIASIAKEGDGRLYEAARNGWDRLPLFLKRLVPRPAEPLEVCDAMAAVGPDAIPAIIGCLRDRHARIRWSAIAALKEFCTESSMIKSVLPGMIRELNESDMKPAIPELIRSLKDRSADVREIAASILGQLGPVASQAVGSLIAGLRDEGVTSDGPLLMARGTNECLYGTVRAACTQALGKIGPPAKPAIPMLTRLIHDANVDVRIKAIVALRHIGCQVPDTVPLLREALKTFPDERRVEPTSAIVEMGLGAEEMRSLLLESLEIDSPALQRLAAERLKEDGDQAKVVTALTLMLDDPRSWVRRNAAEALGVFGPEAKSALPKLTGLAAASDSVERYCVGIALRQIDPKAAASRIQ